RDERVTVLSGRVGVGFGDQFDETRLRYFEAGGYYVNPTPAPHFVFFPVDTVVQITGIGPWQTHLLPMPAASE
ncbi:MAG: cupin domain-containing protein, partial [Nevskiales bacterium]